MAPAIALEDVHKRYRIYRERYRSLKEIVVHRRFGDWEDRWALRGVSFEVEPGSTFGLIGPNGAGKSTTLKLIAGILRPDRGRVSVRGKTAALIELGAGFQLEYTGRENIYLNGSLLGLSRREINRKLKDIVGFAELEEHIDAPLRTYSSGMYMRLGFAVAIHVDPEILLVDEILAVGDEAFQRKCIDWLEGFQRRGGTIVMVSHSLATVRQMCTRTAWIEHGDLVRLGPPAEVVGAYLDQVRESRLDEQQERRAHALDRPDIELGEVRLLDASGRPARILEPGEPLRIEIPYRCHRRVESPVFGVMIHRNDGVLVHGTNTREGGLALDSIGEGGVICLNYPSLPLLGGTYLVTVAVAPASDLGNPIDHHEQRYSFRVRDHGAEIGVVSASHDWRLEPDRSPHLGRSRV